MVNRIDKLASGNDFQVKEVDEDGRQNQETTPDDDDDNKDGFQKNKEKKQTGSVHQIAGEKNRIATQDIARIEFRKIDLATDPSILTVTIVRMDGTRVPQALLSLPRQAAFRLRGLAAGTALNLKGISVEQGLEFVVPAEKTNTAAQKITFEQETTVSHVFHPQKSWESLAEKLFMREPATGNWRFEILGVYAVVLVVLCFFIFGWIYLSV